MMTCSAAALDLSLIHISMKNKGPLYVLTCYVIWGLLPIFWKLLAQVDSLYVLASRIVWSMVLTGGILLLRRDRLAGVRAAFRDRREWGLLAAAGCVVCVLSLIHIWVAPFGAAAQMPQPEAEHDGCRHLDIKCQCKQEGRAVQGHGGEPVAQPAPQAGHQGQQQELPGLHRAPPFQKARGVSA